MVSQGGGLFVRYGNAFKRVLIGLFGGLLFYLVFRLWRIRLLLFALCHGLPRGGHRQHYHCHRRYEGPHDQISSSLWPCARKRVGKLEPLFGRTETAKIKRERASAGTVEAAYPILNIELCECSYFGHS